jgi:hypothetical protein
MLTNRRDSSMGVILQRKTVPSSSKRDFEGLLCKFLQARKLDVDHDLAFHFRQTPAHRASQSLTQHAWLAYVQGQSSKNCWAGSDLARGSVIDVSPPKLRDMFLPFDTDNFANEAVESGRNLSCGQRANFLAGCDDPDNLFHKLLSAAFAGWVPQACSRRDQPLAVCCLLDPINEAAPLAVCLSVDHHGLDLIGSCLIIPSMAAPAARGARTRPVHTKYCMSGADHTQVLQRRINKAQNIDLRGFVIPGTELIRKTLQGSTDAACYQGWFRGDYNIEGFAKKPMSTWPGAMPTPPTFEVSVLDAQGRPVRIQVLTTVHVNRFYLLMCAP